jgi:hypothetical protein
LGWDIIHDTLPDPQERVSAFSSSQGSILRIIYDEFKISPTEWTRETAISGLKWLIKNIDLGNDGIFNDAWCVEADMKWSKGRESREAFEPFRRLSNPPFAYEEYTGRNKRSSMRETAIRFLLYYIAGYNVKFEW